MKVALVILLAFAQPFAATAQFNPAGTIAGPVDTVAAALQARDETGVVLTGRILERIRSETYLFSDETGQVRLDMDDDVWGGVEVGPETIIRVVGETDRGVGSMDIWVHSIERVDAADTSDQQGAP